jgi:hypothetical protein
MKKLFLFAMILSALQSFGQTVDVFVFTPYTSSRYRSSDSIQVGFQLSTNNAASPAQITSIVQTAGPAVKFTINPSWTTGTTTNSDFWLQGLQPGTYSFTATGKSSSGTTGTQTKTFTVIADPVCPVCPTCPPPPAPRIATSITFTFFGKAVTIPLPATGAGITYDNGSTQ